MTKPSRRNLKKRAARRMADAFVFAVARAPGGALDLTLFAGGKSLSRRLDAHWAQALAESLIRSPHRKASISPPLSLELGGLAGTPLQAHSDAVPLQALWRALDDLKYLIDHQSRGTVMHPSGLDACETEGYKRASDLLLRYAPKYFECPESKDVGLVLGITVARVGLDHVSDPVDHFLHLLRDVRVSLAERGIEVLRHTTHDDARLLGVVPAAAAPKGFDTVGDIEQDTQAPERTFRGDGHDS